MSILKNIESYQSFMRDEIIKEVAEEQIRLRVNNHKKINRTIEIIPSKEKEYFSCEVNKTSYIIAFEGNNKVGKTTIINLMEECYEKDRIKGFDKIRKITYTSPDKKLSIKKTYLFYQKQHENIYKNLYKELIENERVLYILDRSILSNISYNYEYWTKKQKKKVTTDCIVPELAFQISPICKVFDSLSEKSQPTIFSFFDEKENCKLLDITNKENVTNTREGIQEIYNKISKAIND